MRRPIVAALVAGSFIAACKSEPSASSETPASSGNGGTSNESDTSNGTPSRSTPSPRGDGTDAAKVYPVAKGDPCRGVALPPTEHHVPAGMCGRLVAAGITGIRQIMFAPNGDLWAATLDGSVFRMHDGDDDGFFAASEIVRYAKSNGNGNNVHLDVVGGFIYAGSQGGVVRWPYSETAASGGVPEDVIVDMAWNGHSAHTAHVWDGYIYVQAGSAGNATLTGPATPYDTQRSLVKRFPLASFDPKTPFDFLTSGEIVSAGLRNTNGFTRNAAGKIFGVVNGLDAQTFAGEDVHDDNPGEQVVEIAIGKNYGYPFCFTAQRVVNGTNSVMPAGVQLRNPAFPDPTKDDKWCGPNSLQPATFIQAHSAPLDIVFFDEHPSGNLPEKYRGGAFVALHGSWNRVTPTGYKVIWIPFDANGRAPMPKSTPTETTFPYETVFGGGDANGPKDGSWSWSSMPYIDAPRPAGVAIGPVDGALYVTTDEGGMVYRVGVKK